MTLLTGDVLITVTALARGVSAVWVPSQLRILVSDRIPEHERDEAVIQLVRKILDGHPHRPAPPGSPTTRRRRARPATGS